MEIPTVALNRAPTLLQNGSLIHVTVRYFINGRLGTSDNPLSFQVFFIYLPVCALDAWKIMQCSRPNLERRLEILHDLTRKPGGWSSLRLGIHVCLRPSTFLLSAAAPYLYLVLTASQS